MQTLAELEDAFQLYAVCEPCHRVVHLPLSGLIDRHGADCRIDRVRMRLLCTQCGQRSAALRIVYVGRDGRAASFRYAR